MLDWSRRLRMDEPKPSIPPDALYEVIGADPAPIAVDVRRPTDPDDAPVVPAPHRAERLPADPARESSLIVYCENEEEVREGFVIALRAILLHADIVPTTTAGQS